MSRFNFSSFLSKMVGIRSLLLFLKGYKRFFFIGAVGLLISNVILFSLVYIQFNTQNSILINFAGNYGLNVDSEESFEIQIQGASDFRPSNVIFFDLKENLNNIFTQADFKSFIDEIYFVNIIELYNATDVIRYEEEIDSNSNFNDPTSPQTIKIAVISDNSAQTILSENYHENDSYHVIKGNNHFENNFLTHSIPLMTFPNSNVSNIQTFPLKEEFFIDELISQYDYSSTLSIPKDFFTLIDNADILTSSNSFYTRFNNFSYLSIGSRILGEITYRFNVLQANKIEQYLESSNSLVEFSEKNIINSNMKIFFSDGLSSLFQSFNQEKSEFDLVIIVYALPVVLISLWINYLILRVVARGYISGLSILKVHGLEDQDLLKIITLERGIIFFSTVILGFLGGIFIVTLDHLLINYHQFSVLLSPYFTIFGLKSSGLIFYLALVTIFELLLGILLFQGLRQVIRTNLNIKNQINSFLQFDNKYIDLLIIILGLVIFYILLSVEDFLNSVTEILPDYFEFVLNFSWFLNGFMVLIGILGILRRAHTYLFVNVGKLWKIIPNKNFLFLLQQKTGIKLFGGIFSILVISSIMTLSFYQLQLISEQHYLNQARATVGSDIVIEKSNYSLEEISIIIENKFPLIEYQTMVVGQFQLSTLQGNFHFALIDPELFISISYLDELDPNFYWNEDQISIIKNHGMILSENLRRYLTNDGIFRLTMQNSSAIDEFTSYNFQSSSSYLTIFPGILTQSTPELSSLILIGPSAFESLLPWIKSSDIINRTLLQLFHIRDVPLLSDFLSSEYKLLTTSIFDLIPSEWNVFYPLILSLTNVYVTINIFLIFLSLFIFIEGNLPTIKKQFDVLSRMGISKRNFVLNQFLQLIFVIILPVLILSLLIHPIISELLLPLYNLEENIQKFYWRDIPLDTFIFYTLLLITLSLLSALYLYKRISQTVQFGQE